MVVQAIKKGGYNYGISIRGKARSMDKQKKSSSNEDQWADSLIKWLFIILIIVGMYLILHSCSF